MAQLPGGQFDSSKHDDMRSGFDPLPPGEYPVKIVKSSDQITKNKKGKMWKLEFDVLSGKFKGRKVWENLLLEHESEMAVKIANEKLATICRAVGKLNIVNTEELHGFPMIVKLKVTPGDGKTIPPGNEIIDIKPYVEEGMEQQPASESGSEEGEAQGDLGESAAGGTGIPWKKGQGQTP